MDMRAENAGQQLELIAEGERLLNRVLGYQAAMAVHQLKDDLGIEVTELTLSAGPTLVRSDRRLSRGLHDRERDRAGAYRAGDHRGAREGRREPGGAGARLNRSPPESRRDEPKASGRTRRKTEGQEPEPRRPGADPSPSRCQIVLVSDAWLSV